MRRRQTLAAYFDRAAARLGSVRQSSLGQQPHLGSGGSVLHDPGDRDRHARHHLRPLDQQPHARSASGSPACSPIGSIAMMAGLMWHWSFPINKSLWTSSYVLFTAGMGAVTLATCMWIIDEHRVTGWTKPFVIYGMNPIVAFVGSGIMARLIYSDLQGGVQRAADRAAGVDVSDVLRLVARAAERLVAVRDHFRPRVARDPLGAVPTAHLREALANTLPGAPCHFGQHRLCSPPTLRSRRRARNACCHVLHREPASIDSAAAHAANGRGVPHSGRARHAHSELHRSGWRRDAWPGQGDFGEGERAPIGPIRDKNEEDRRAPTARTPYGPTSTPLHRTAQRRCAGLRHWHVSELARSERQLGCHDRVSDAR